MDGGWARNASRKDVSQPPPARACDCGSARRTSNARAPRPAASVGLSGSAVHNRAATGRLHRVYRGVYSLVPPKLLTREGRYLAAVFACGPGAVLSHRSAAVLHGLRDWGHTKIDVTIPGRSARRHDGIVVHRSTTLTDKDVTVVDGIPCTTVGADAVRPRGGRHPPGARARLRPGGGDGGVRPARPARPTRPQPHQTGRRARPGRPRRALHRPHADPVRARGSRACAEPSGRPPRPRGQRIRRPGRRRAAASRPISSGVSSGSSSRPTAASSTARARRSSATAATISA